MANPFLAAALRMQAGQPGRRAGGFATSYRGASTGPTVSDWIMRPVSADEAARYDIQSLRVRARDLVMNDAVAARIPKVFAENIVGEYGYTLQAQIQTTRGGAHDGMSSRVEAAFMDWADNFCTVDGRHSFADVQGMAVENECVDGEFLAHHVRGADNPYGYALELLDPDQLDHTRNVAETADGGAIRMGVQVDKWRRPVLYWLFKGHPSEVRGSARQYNYVPAADVVHLYVATRPQQSRGVSWLAPAMLNLKMLSGGREAVLVAMRAAAANSVMFEVAEGSDYTPPVDAAGQSTAIIPTDLEPGAGYELPPGITAKFNNPPFADSAFGPFQLDIIRTTAAAVGISYASLSGDLTGASYGSQRQGALSEQAGYRKQQRRHERSFVTPVYRAWLESALLTGALRADSLDPRKYWAVKWHPRTFPWVDPKKDGEAADKAIGMGVETLTALNNAKGQDFTAIIDERAKEIAYARSKGVPLFVGNVDVTGLVASQTPTAPDPNTDANGDERPTDTNPNNSDR